MIKSFIGVRLPSSTLALLNFLAFISAKEPKRHRRQFSHERRAKQNTRRKGKKCRTTRQSKGTTKHPEYLGYCLVEQ